MLVKGGPEVSQFVLRENKYTQCPKIEVVKQML